MGSYWKIVHDVINKSDIVLIVADARTPESVNAELFKKIKQLEKKHIVVYNKFDLLNQEEQKNLKEKLKAEPFSIVISAMLHKNTMTLLRRLNAIAQGKPATVGIVGYPNTGKSSLINALKGRNSSLVGAQAGVTRGIQKLRITKNITIFDSPGVIPSDEKYNIVLQSKIAAKSPNQIRDVEGVAMNLIVDLKGVVESHYGVEKTDPDVVLERIAEKLQLKKKGNVPDTRRAADRLIYDWQRGIIRTP